MRVARSSCRRVAGAAAESRLSRRRHRGHPGAAIYFARRPATSAWRSRRAIPRAQSAMRVASRACRRVAGAAAESRLSGRVHRRHPGAAIYFASRPATSAWRSRRAIPRARSVMRVARIASKHNAVRPAENRLSRRRHRRHPAAANSACYAVRVTGLPSRTASAASGPACPARARHVLSSNALVTTLTLENAIAAPAHIGSSMPSAASGMPIRL